MGDFLMFARKMLLTIAGILAFLSAAFADRSCFVCDGRGKHSCSDCKGTGAEFCVRCDGTGLVGGLDSFSRCPDCKGCKHTLVTCWHCNGTGKQKKLIGKKKCETCNGVGGRKKTCSKCSGSGVVQCTLCKGTGQY